MYGTVAQFLQDKIQDGSSLSFVSAYFTIYAFNELKTELNSIDNLRFLFGEPSFISNIDTQKTESKAFLLTEAGLQLSNYLEQKQIVKACAQWIKEKVQIKSVRKSNFLHGKMYYIDNDSSQDAIIGSSNFTVRGLGLSKKTSNIELNLEVDSKTDCAHLKKWFDNLWKSDDVADVKAAVLRDLENAYRDQAPEFIYFKTLYHLFERFLTESAEAGQAQAQRRLSETQIWQQLYSFQRDGVKACIQKIKDYNGCIIADSVGLGKTFEALAIIKYFELQNATVLVLCPKKLEKNWTPYPAYRRNKTNPFKHDRFHYTALAHTDLDKKTGDLAHHEWDAYDLVVIDESHNFRNRGTRYDKLMQNVIQRGGNTKVLMLSATPVNNRLEDLRNQFYLITANKDDSFRNIGIPSIRHTLKTAQAQFDNTNFADKTDEPSQSISADFFKLLDALTIARSRRHVEKFYGDALEQIGGFPEREPPKPIFPQIDLNGKFPAYRTISNQIGNYKLARFNPSNYILEQHQADYEHRRISQREFNLIGMMRVNFLKRLESSVHSFKTTLERTIEKITKLETDIEAFINATAQTANFDPFAEAEEEYSEDEELQTGIQAAGKNQTYRFEHLNLNDWLVDLHHDKTQLEKIYHAAANITPDRDAKLAQLKELIQAKVKQPTINLDGKPNRKILIFTAFADTANYLYDNLKPWATETLQIQAAVVTGTKNKTSFGNRDFDEILTNFSPISKNRGTNQDDTETEDDSKDCKTTKGDTEERDTTQDDTEIDLLIATDCISEGQNLQDCDYLVNYDIHWNPVRIIQRFGRIDRIGSRNTNVKLVNFWPTPELDEYINLKPRVDARMALVDLTATGDDNLLSLKGKQKLKPLWNHRDQQLRRMQNEILDFEDIEEHLNLNQFTLDDFRAQLLNYLRSNEDALKNAPLGLYAVTAASNQHQQNVDIPPGVIFCLKQTTDTNENEKLNPIHPYHLVYISNEGKTSIQFTNPKRVLELFSALAVGKTEPDQNRSHCFNEDTDNGNDMSLYDLLIQEVIESISTAYNKKINDELDTNPDYRLPIADDQIAETTQFELVTWLVISP